MDADRIAWTHYRTVGGERQPIAPAGDQHPHYTPPRRVGLGTITSRRPTGPLFRQAAAATGPIRPPEPPPCPRHCR